MTMTKVSVDYCELTCSGKVIIGDWEGDPSVPNGTRELPPYVDDVTAVAGEVDVYELLSQGVQDEICDKLIAAYEA